MNYIDGFVIAVPTVNKAAYQAYAEKFAAVFKEYGVLNIVECWGDDVPPGKLTSFPLAVQCKEDETVVFSWMTWASKEIRDAGWEKMMKDPRFDPSAMAMPFDGKRMIYGGFQKLLEI
ncbi:MAG: DUF1428 domain-containing protein [Undibacterium sp.]|nr:DUF1428 domain-containing protein [Undibacterium sp.]